MRDEQRSFRPKFTWTQDIALVADKINRPHEDYPLRVDKTIEMIKYYTKHIHESMKGWFSETDLKTIHSFLFEGEGFNEHYIERGEYRKIGVKVGNFVPPQPFHIRVLMENITPVSILEREKESSFFVDDDLKIIDWYILFETVHPFQDGNGRVGGIVVAILSYLKFGKYLMPIP